jgi:hypothetical protein
MADREGNTPGFQTDMGINARVDRGEKLDQDTDRENGHLRGIARRLNPVPKTLKHLGSFAVHTYQSEILGQLFFVKQVVHEGITEEVASKAFEDLRGSTMESFARKRQIRRSGF